MKVTWRGALLIILIFGLTYCEFRGVTNKRTPERAVSIFLFNQDRFSELAELACNYSEQSQLSKFYYEVGDMQEPVHNKLDMLLRSVNAESLSQKTSTEGQCQVIVTYLIYGFAGDGGHILYKFNYNIENPFRATDYRRVDEIKRETGIYRFELPLANDWILSYKKS